MGYPCRLISQIFDYLIPRLTQQPASGHRQSILLFSIGFAEYRRDRCIRRILRGLLAWQFFVLAIDQRRPVCGQGSRQEEGGVLATPAG